MRIVKTEYVTLSLEEWSVFNKMEAYIELIRRECSHPDLNTACEKLLNAFYDVLNFVADEADEIDE